MSAERDLHIAIVATLPLELEKTTGGVETVCVNLLHGFSKIKSFKFSWISYSEKVRELKAIDFSDNTKIFYLPYTFRQFELIDYIFFNRTIKKILTDLGPQVIHVQGASPMLLRLPASVKNRVVVTQHGIMRQEIKHVRGISKKLKFGFKVFVERFIFPQFKNLIFISKYNFSIFPVRRQHKYWFIDNPINPEFFRISDEPRVKNQIIYVGWISVLKNLMLLLKAIKNLRDKRIIYHLVVVGNFKEQSYKSLIMAFITENQLDDQISFKGLLSQKEVRKELSRSEIFVMPSLQENLPVSIAEAMASGVVVLASNVGAISEMFVDGESGFLFKRDSEMDLTYKLSELYIHPESLALVAAAAREIALKRYHPESVCAQTLTVYKSIYENMGKISYE